MIKVSNLILPSHEQMVAVAYGMRNSYNSWDKSDTKDETEPGVFGPKDYELAKRLLKAGPSESKFMRMMPIIFDLTAPIYFWKQFDTYKVGTVRNSTSTMHTITAKEFTPDDFSLEELVWTVDWYNGDPVLISNKELYSPKDVIEDFVIPILNRLRLNYMNASDPSRKKKLWYNIIQMLPSSYNQKATIETNYQVLRTMYEQRYNHKLTEWRDFCDYISYKIPMSDLITNHPAGD